MRAYVTAFAVAIVSTSVFAASTSLHRRFLGDEVQQVSLDLSELLWKKWTTLLDSDNPPNAAVGEVTDGEVHAQRFLSNFDGPSGVSMSASPPGGHTSYAMPAITPQDKSNNAPVAHIDPRLLSNTASTSERIEDSGSLHISSAMGHGSDIDDQHSTPEQQSIDTFQRLTFDNEQENPDQLKLIREGKSDMRTTANGLIVHYKHKVNKIFGILAEQKTGDIDVAEYILAGNPSSLHLDNQQATEYIICFVYWSMQDQSFKFHIDRMDKVEGYPMEKYGQILAEQLPMLIIRRVWKSDHIDFLKDYLKRRIGKWNDELKSTTPEGLDVLTDLFRQKYTTSRLDSARCALPLVTHGLLKSKFEEDLRAKLRGEGKGSAHRINKAKLAKQRQKQSAEP